MRVRVSRSATGNRPPATCPRCSPGDWNPVKQESFRYRARRRTLPAGRRPRDPPTPHRRRRSARCRGGAGGVVRARPPAGRTAPRRRRARPGRRRACGRPGRTGRARSGGDRAGSGGARSRPPARGPAPPERPATRTSAHRSPVRTPRPCPPPTPLRGVPTVRPDDLASWYHRMRKIYSTFAPNHADSPCSPVASAWAYDSIVRTSIVPGVGSRFMVQRSRSLIPNVAP
jgi:hypothetical protein